MRNDLLAANLGILIFMILVGYFSFFKYKKEKKIMFRLSAIYALFSIVLSIINISFVLYYNSEQDDQYFKNHPNLETLQNVNWYMLAIPIFLLFIISRTRPWYGYRSDDRLFTSLLAPY